MSEQELFAVGDTLKCGKYVRRQDSASALLVGDEVTVLQEFTFNYKGQKCQDITVQRKHDAPIAVMVEAGLFTKIK